MPLALVCVLVLVLLLKLQDLIRHRRLNVVDIIFRNFHHKIILSLHKGVIDLVRIRLICRSILSLTIALILVFPLAWRWLPVFAPLTIQADFVSFYAFFIQS